MPSKQPGSVLNFPAFPATKLQAPQLAEDVLARPHLTDELYLAATSQRLTLLSAPAGAGKTTAVLAMRKAHPELPLVWLSLDESDDDTQLFFGLLLAGIRKLVPECGRQTSQILAAAAQNEVPVLQVAASLINEMVAHLEGPFVILLEDLHRISSTQIHELLDYLLERAPANIHFVITSRHDPPLRLGQLRSKGQMAEIRLERLRLDDMEIARLLNNLMGLQIAPEDLSLVRARTEGWPAGLRLLTLSLKQLQSPDARSKLIGDLSKSQRLLFDYLVEEVLNQLDADIRDFLLQTSILEELTPELCNAVARREDAADVLDTIYRRNLFLSIAEAQDPAAAPSYRYHALFAQFLRKQLRQRADMDLPALHLRAAQAESTPGRRIPHFLEAEAWDEAIEEIIAIGRIQSDQGYVPKRTIAWIERIPNEVQAAHYWLDLIRSSHASQMGRTGKANTLAQPVLPLAEEAGDTAAVVEALWSIAYHFRENPEHEAWLRLDALLEEQQDAVSLDRRIRYHIGKAWRGLDKTDWQLAEKHLEEFFRLMGQLDRIGFGHYQSLGAQWLFATGGMGRIKAFDARILSEVGEETDSILQAGPFMRRAWIAFLQCDLQRCQAHIDRARRSAQSLGTFAFVDISIDYIELNLMVAQAEYEHLIKFVEQREQSLNQVDTHRATLPSFYFPLWRVHWSQDQLELAAVAQKRFMASLDDSDFAASPTVGILRGWEAFAAGKPTKAEGEFLEALRRHRKLRWVGTFGNAGVDLALFYFLQGEEDKALATWTGAADEMRRRGMPGQTLITGRKVVPLLEMAVRQDRGADMAAAALSAFGRAFTPHAIAIPGSEESLTPRESEVLRLLMQGASNQEIAAQLVFTERTAKAHVSHILNKLGVSSRTEAVARAHELSLL